MATETLRPNAAGDENTIDFQIPADSFPATDHWNKVDEEVADEVTYLDSQSLIYQRDLYNLPASSGSGTINFIKIYFRCRGGGLTNGDARPALKSNSTVTDGTEVNLAGAWTTYSQQWNTNPASEPDAWTWADIDALQIGVSLKKYADGQAQVTQVYVEVDYTVITWSKVGGVASANISKVMTVPKANIARVKGVLSA